MSRTWGGDSSPCRSRVNARSPTHQSHPEDAAGMTHSTTDRRLQRLLYGGEHRGVRSRYKSRGTADGSAVSGTGIVDDVREEAPPPIL